MSIRSEQGSPGTDGTEVADPGLRFRRCERSRGRDGRPERFPLVERAVERSRSATYPADHALSPCGSLSSPSSYPTQAREGQTVDSRGRPGSRISPDPRSVVIAPQTSARGIPRRDRAPPSCSHLAHDRTTQVGTGRPSDDTRRHAETGFVSNASNRRIRWPRGRGSSSLPSRTVVLAFDAAFSGPFLRRRFAEAVHTLHEVMSPSLHEPTWRCPSSCSRLARDRTTPAGLDDTRRHTTIRRTRIRAQREQP
jgi:hypothetical protein